MSGIAQNVLWSVIEEHLEEAEFAVQQWERALDSPAHTLEELSDGPEEALRAHIDSLLLAGPSAVERLLQPEVESAESPLQARVVAASVALIAHRREDLVWRAVVSDTPVVTEAARRALILAAPPTFDAWVAQALSRKDLSQGERKQLLSIAAARAIRLDNVLAAMQSADPQEAAAATTAALWADPAKHLPLAEHLASHTDRTVRDAALVTALTHGSFYAFQQCLTLAQAPDPEPLAMVLVALLGEPAHHRTLVAQMDSPSHGHAALRALGYTGQVALAPELLARMTGADVVTARLAGEAFALLTGLDTSMDEFAITGHLGDEPPSLPPLEEEDLDAPLAPQADEGLPIPSALAIAAWWQAHGPNLDRDHRVLFGRRWGLSSALAALERTTLRRRHAVALGLLIRSGGAIRIDTRALTHVQRTQLSAASAQDDRALVRRFGGW